MKPIYLVHNSEDEFSNVLEIENDHIITLNQGVQEVLNVIKRHWISFLQSKQSNFVKKLESGISNLSVYERQNHFSESIILTSDNKIISVDDFLEISSTVFKLEKEKNYQEESWLKGKIGEIVVRYQFSDLLTSVDHSFHLNNAG